MVRLGTVLRWYALKRILKREIQDGSIILDIGGYDGYIAYKVKKMFSHLTITVIDTDTSGLEIAKQRGLQTLHASALALPIEDNQVDVVLCLDLIEHIEKDGSLIKEIARVLHRDSKVILTTPMENGISFPFLDRKKIDMINKDWGHVRKGYCLEKIKSLFNDNGLTVVRTNTYFNYLTRCMYWLICFSGIPLRGKNFLYRTVLQLEPFITYGAEGHIIIGIKSKP